MGLYACLSTVYVIHLLVFLVKRVGGAPRGVRNKHIGDFNVFQLLGSSTYVNI